MTISHDLDLTKSLTENVEAIHRLIRDERNALAPRGTEWTPENLQLTLVLSRHDWFLLVSQCNAFGISGMDLVTKAAPKLHIRLIGTYDSAAIECDRKKWNDHPDHLAQTAFLRQITRARLENELGIPIPPEGLPPSLRPSWLHWYRRFR